jgi:hypothetical protein
MSVKAGKREEGIGKMDKLSCWHCLHADIKGLGVVLCKNFPDEFYITSNEEILENDSRRANDLHLVRKDPKEHWCTGGFWAIRMWHETNFWDFKDIMTKHGIRPPKTVNLITREGKNIEAELPWMGSPGKWLDWRPDEEVIS